MGAITNRYFHAFAICSLLLAATGTQAGSIVGSKHDLTPDGVQLCVHCHMPNSTQTSPGKAPLWNEKNTHLNAFTPYTSPLTSETCPARPGGISMVCMSCHDGTGGMEVHGGNQPSTAGVSPNMTGVSNKREECFKCHANAPDSIYSKTLKAMGAAEQQDLRNYHPVSRAYPASPSFKSPPDATKGWLDVRLFDGKVECPSCHAVHDPTVVPFLSMTNNGSALCLKCHNK